ncbi:CD151 antigen-like [Bradysia coprophila]|uniref:CD151 antigen-like n=1 Tax=Bradysia coprophila TaxID=38358 RepID=UPI00187D8BA6|nr:CD151 antigen-like [Bradysia coprophila]
MNCSKCLLIFLNVLYLCSSVLIVTAGIIAKIFVGNYDFLSEGISIFSTLWIAAGCCLLVISIFGITVSFGSSTILINGYAILLAAIVVLQISAAVAGFSVSACRSKEIISDTMTSLIQSYDHQNDTTTSRETIDWIQSKFHCCGNKSPDDWTALKPAEDGSKNYPFSCCVHEVDGGNAQCTDHFKNGCLNDVHGIVSDHVAMISLIALVVAAVQIIGIFAAYLRNKAIRNSRKLDDTDYTKLDTKGHSFY